MRVSTLVLGPGGQFSDSFSTAFFIAVPSETIYTTISGTVVTIGDHPNPGLWTQSLKTIYSWGDVGLMNICNAIRGADVHTCHTPCHHW
jgi:hypothetical protein